MLSGRIQLVSLDEDGGHADVHVGRSAEHLVSRTRSDVQSALVDSQCIVESALRHPDVGQRDSARHDIREVASLVEARHCIGVIPVRGVEIGVRPLSQTDERKCRSAAEVVVVPEKFERPPSMADRASMITEELSEPGPVDCDRAGQVAEGLLVHDDRLACGQRALGVL